jgi:hypothetical protein
MHGQNTLILNSRSTFPGNRVYCPQTSHISAQTQLNRQIRVAGGAKIEWPVAENEAATKFNEILQDIRQKEQLDVSNIEIIFDP